MVPSCGRPPFTHMLVSLLLPLLHPQPLPQGTNATYIACAQKLIVVLTVDSGDTIASQELSFQLSCVGRCAATTEQASRMAERGTQHLRQLHPVLQEWQHLHPAVAAVAGTTLVLRCQRPEHMSSPRLPEFRRV